MAPLVPLTAKTREKVAELSGTFSNKHIWVIKETVWISNMGIPKRTNYLPNASQ